jgi:hypothetical protein
MESKSAMRTGLRKSEGVDMIDYKYNHKDWAESLSRVGKPKEEVIKEESITVINMGTRYKVKSVSADLGARIRVGEMLTDTHIDDLKESGVNISYVKESIDLDTKNADKAMKHDCATHVVHKEHGTGQCIPGQHTLVEKDKVECEKCDGTGKVDGEICKHCNGKGFHMEGFVTHYDVMFESGIKEDVPVEDLEIVKEMHHSHSKKKKELKAFLDVNVGNKKTGIGNITTEAVQQNEVLASAEPPILPKRPAGPAKVGGMGTVANDIENLSPAIFKRKYGKTKEDYKKSMNEDEESRKIKPQYNTQTHKLVAKNGSVRIVPKDYQLKDGEHLAEAVDLDAANVEVMLRHDCANHVRHSVHGEGVCVPGEHTLEEISEGEGMVTHYDVMFESGIIEDVPVYELEIISEQNHMHASKKKDGKKVLMDKKKKKDDDNGDNGDDNGDNGDEDNLDPVDPKALKGTHDDREDGDIDNDGDEDDSDKFLHKKRKAITKKIKKENVTFNKKSVFKEWVSMGRAKLDQSKPKDAMHAHTIAKHFYQIAIRDDMFGKKAQFTENMGLAKKFFGIYKKLETEGDTTAKNLYKDGSEEAIENFNQSEISQTNESWFEPAGQARGDHVKKPATSNKVSKITKVTPKALTKFGKHMDKQLADKDRAQMKSQGTIKMRKTDADGIHGTTVQQNDTAKIAALKAKGYVKVSESSDQNPNIPYPPDEAKKLAAKKERDRKGKTHFQGFNDRRDKGIKSKPIDKDKFFGKTKTGGVQNESYDSTNMPEHAPEVVEMTPDAYGYNRSSWLNAMNEVNRYKGKSGHRVTQPDKSGDEHIVMQLRKAISVGPNHTGVKFKDGETHKISAKTAQKHLDHYSKLKPEDKIKWQNSASHSHGGLSSASGEKKLGQAKPKAAFKRDEPTRQLINPMDKD